MSFNFANQNFDKCSIQGSCVQEPYVNSINEYITASIINLIYYVKKLDELNYQNFELKKEIISFYAQANLNFEFHSKDLVDIVNYVYAKICEVENLYKNTCKEQNIRPQNIKKIDKLPRTTDINDVAKFGEKIFLKRQNTLSEKENTIYTIFIIFLKSLTQTLCELYFYNELMEEETNAVIDALGKLNTLKNAEKEFVKTIQGLYETNYKLLYKRYEIYKKHYGDIVEKELNFSSRKNKCILISGKTFKDLKDLLFALDNENIDVYTHEKMIFAHQYKFFDDSQNLVGQFQKDENSLKYDFSTFPGPIIIGKFQQNKFEGIYRGNLFTTNKIAPYGVSVIADNDFSKVIETAKNSKGFRKTHTKESIKIGYDTKRIEKFIENLKQNIMSGKYNSVMFIGLLHNRINNAEFYQKLAKKLDKKTFFISLACDLNIENSIHFPSFYDYSLSFKILKELSELKKEKDFKINVYLTDTTSYLTPIITLLNYMGIDKIFIQESKKLPNTNSLEEILNTYVNTYTTKFDMGNDIKILEN